MHLRKPLEGRPSLGRSAILMEDSKHSAPLGGQGERPSCDVFTKGMCPTFQACPMSGNLEPSSCVAAGG